MPQTLHIVFGFSVAQSLNQALHLGKGDILIFEDTFECGPIIDFASLDEWTTARKEYWNDIIERGDGITYPEFGPEPFRISNTSMKAGYPTSQVRTR